MLLRTVGLRGPVLPGVATSDVLSMSDRFEVCRVVAIPNPAAMIELQTFRDRPNYFLVDDLVHLAYADTQMDATIPSVIGIAGPKPATRSDHAITQRDTTYT